MDLLRIHECSTWLSILCVLFLWKASQAESRGSQNHSQQYLIIKGCSQHQPMLWGLGNQVSSPGTPQGYQSPSEVSRQVPGILWWKLRTLCTQGIIHQDTWIISLDPLFHHPKKPAFQSHCLLNVPQAWSITLVFPMGGPGFNPLWDGRGKGEGECVHAGSTMDWTFLIQFFQYLSYTGNLQFYLSKWKKEHKQSK